MLQARSSPVDSAPWSRICARPRLDDLGRLCLHQNRPAIFHLVNNRTPDLGTGDVRFRRRCNGPVVTNPTGATFVGPGSDTGWRLRQFVKVSRRLAWQLAWSAGRLSDENFVNLNATQYGASVVGPQSLLRWSGHQAQQGGLTGDRSTESAHVQTERTG